MMNVKLRAMVSKPNNSVNRRAAMNPQASCDAARWPPDVRWLWRQCHLAHHKALAGTSRLLALIINSVSLRAFFFGVSDPPMGSFFRLIE